MHFHLIAFQTHMFVSFNHNPKTNQDNREHPDLKQDEGQRNKHRQERVYQPKLWKQLSEELEKVLKFTY